MQKHCLVKQFSDIKNLTFWDIAYLGQSCVNLAISVRVLCTVARHVSYILKGLLRQEALQ